LIFLYTILRLHVDLFTAERTVQDVGTVLYSTT